MFDTRPKGVAWTGFLHKLDLFILIFDLFFKEGFVHLLGVVEHDGVLRGHGVHHAVGQREDTRG